MNKEECHTRGRVVNGVLFCERLAARGWRNLRSFLSSLKRFTGCYLILKDEQVWFDSLRSRISTGIPQKFQLRAWHHVSWRSGYWPPPDSLVNQRRVPLDEGCSCGTSPVSWLYFNTEAVLKSLSELLMTICSDCSVVSLESCDSGGETMCKWTEVTSRSLHTWVKWSLQHQLQQPVALSTLME